MGGNGGIDPVLQEIAGEFEEAPVHLALAWEGDGGGFEVSAFAQADADFGGAQLFDIGLAAVQVALNHHADRAVARVQRMHQIERATGIGAGFHIDANKAADFGGAADQPLDVGQALLRGKIEAELGELERDVALNPAAVEGVEGPQVDVAGFGGLREGGDALAQVVECHGDAFGVELTGHGQGFLEGLTSHEPGGEPARQGRGFHPSAQPFQTGQEEEEAAHRG